MTAEKYPPVSAESHRRQMAAVVRRTAALVVTMARTLARHAPAEDADTINDAADDLAHQLDVLARPIGMAVAPGAIVEAPTAAQTVNTPQTFIEPTRARRVIHDPALTGTWEEPPKPLSEMIAESRRQPEDPRLPKERDEE